MLEKVAAWTSLVLAAAFVFAVTVFGVPAGRHAATTTNKLSIASVWTEARPLGSSQRIPVEP